MLDQMTAEISSGSNGNSKRKRGSDWVRKRVSQACDQCRKKKLKCDGLHPTCSTCVILGRACLYEDAVKKRGLPEGYVRGLETLLGLLQSDVTRIGDVSTLFSSAMKDEAAKLELIQIWNGEGVYEETRAEKWRSSKLCKALEFLLPALDAGDGKGPESKRLRMEPHSVDHGGLGALQNSEPCLPPPEAAEGLFNLYFKYTHSWFPVVGKDELLASYYRTLALAETSLGNGENAVLWAVLAYAEWHRDASNGDATIACMQLSSKAGSYYNKARILIPDERSDLDIGHVQALLVLALIKMGMGKPRASWMLVNQAITNAIDLGVTDVSCSTLNGSAERSKRVFLGCFHLDTLLAACLGRPPRFRKEDALSISPLNENGMEEWGYLDVGPRRVGEQAVPSHSISIFNRLIRLICILDDLPHDFCPARLKGNLYEDINTAFQQWKISLPSFCSVSKTPSNMHLPPHQLNLHLTFLVCKLVYQRRYGISTQALWREVKELCQLVESLENPSALESNIYLPIFSLIIGLALEDSSTHQREWAASCTHTAASSCRNENVVKSGTIVAGVRISRMGPDLPKDFGNVATTLSKSANGLHAIIDMIAQSSEDMTIENGSLLSETAAALPSSGIVASTKTTLNWQAENIGCNVNDGGLFPGFLPFQVNQIQPGREERTVLDAPLSDLPIPDLTEREIEEMALQNIDFTDDYFFELSNLDQLCVAHHHFSKLKC